MKKQLLSLALVLLLCLGLAVPAGAETTIPNPYENPITTDPLYQAIMWAVDQSLEKGRNFSDVGADHPFYEAIAWAVTERIAAGYEDKTFRPGNTCSRAQIATFLWRAAGKPAPADMFSTFTDVTPSIGDDFYTAVLWIAGKGAASGDIFEPNGSCTRLTAVEFLWIAAGSPEAEEAASFTDVADNSAVNWAVSKGITNGYGDGAFHPDDACTRGQIAAFLYRAGSEAFRQ